MAAVAGGEGFVLSSCCSGSVFLVLYVLAAYTVLIQLLRFRRVRKMQTLDAPGDSWEVYRQMEQLEFPFIMTKALEFALFRTYGVPSISGLLNSTREFQKHAGKRYDDTDIMLRELSENRLDTDRSRVVMARLNAIHAMYAKKISNADMLYTISLFVTEPAIWINRFGWRRCTAIEKNALLQQYVISGERMGIRGLRNWKTWDDAKAFVEAYEKDHYQFAKSNGAIARDTITLFLSVAPKFMRPAALWLIYALMDPPLLAAMGLPQAPKVLQWFTNGILLLRATFIRFFMPPRPEMWCARRTPAKDDVDVSDDGVGLKKTNFDQYHEPKLGCAFYQNGYRSENLGTSSCPAGRLLKEGLPLFTGTGGGGNNDYSTPPLGSAFSETKKSA